MIGLSRDSKFSTWMAVGASVLVALAPSAYLLLDTHVVPDPECPLCALQASYAAIPVASIALITLFAAVFFSPWGPGRKAPSILTWIAARPRAPPTSVA